MIPVYQVPPHALQTAGKLIAKIVAQRGWGFFKRERVYTLTIDVVRCGVDWNLYATEPEKLAGDGDVAERLLAQYRAALESSPGVPVLCAFFTGETSYSWVTDIAHSLVQARGQA